MKKAALLLIVVVIAIISGCGKKHEHNYTSSITKEPTILEEGIKTWTCAECGESYEEAIPKLESNWEISSFSDDFGDKTSDEYIVGTFKGTFSNSATNESEATIKLYFVPTYSHKQARYHWEVCFKLIEYSDNNVVFDELSQKCMFKYKRADGSTGQADCSQYGYRIEGAFMDVSLVEKDGHYVYTLFEEIPKNEVLKCVIEISNNYSTIKDKYSFEINNVGLQELIDQIESQ